MNKRVHRLVFDRRRGMRVPAAEHVRSSGKAGAGESRAVARTAQALVATMAAAGPAALGVIGEDAHAQTRTMGSSVVRSAAITAITPPPMRNLPWASNQAGLLDTDLKKNQGDFTIGNYLDALASKELDITQRSAKGILNWDSFNIGQGYTVRFIQPDASSSVLNNIWDSNPSVILGQIKANGEVILQNHNGVIFGPTARIDTARFVTTALKLANDTYNKGIRNDTQGNVIFGDDESLPTGFITVERGAEIKALAGGDVIMVAPKVYNEGTIETPKGQTVLAAGQKVYLYNSVDPAQRGLVVAVDAFANSSNDVNTVENAAALDNKASTNISNYIKAEQGEVNLVGMTVRQNGVITATTAVKGQNGAIYLQGMKTTGNYTPPTIPGVKGNTSAQPKRGAAMGTVELGENSVTQVLPETDSTATQKDAETYYRSKVDIRGQDVRIRSGALVKANSGNINVLAASSGDNKLFATGDLYATDNSHLVVDQGAVIDASGLKDVQVAMSRNQLDGRLFQIELADSPVQRGGVLYRQEILSNANRAVSVANVKGQYNLIERTAAELSTRGGNVRLESQGDSVIADGATVDISGGSIQYQAGTVSTSYVRKGNQLIAIDKADPKVKYDELLAPSNPVGLAQISSYEQGADAGTLAVSGTNMYVGGNVKANAVVGRYQRNGQINTGYVTAADTTSLLDEGSDELGRAQILLDHPELYGQLLPSQGKVTIGRYDQGKGILNQEVDLVSGTPAHLGVVPELDSAAADAFFAQIGATAVSSTALQSGGVGQLALNANTVSLARDVNLDLGTMGQLTVNAQHINVASSIKATGGSLSFNAVAVGGDGNINVQDGAHLDTSGTLLDERGAASTAQSIHVDGGNINLTAMNSVDVAAGSALDVSAGVWRTANGTTTTGKAGGLSVEVNSGFNTMSFDPTGMLTLAGQMSAFDFKSGGTLSVSGVRSMAYGEAAAMGGWTLDSSLFNDHGFGTFKLSALGDVTVAAGAVLAPQLKNLVLNPSRAGAGLSMTAVQTLDTGLREGVKLGLTASKQPGEAPKSADLVDGGSVNVGANSLIDAGAGGSVSLIAGRKIEVQGTVRARAGTIALALEGAHGSESDQVDQATDRVGANVDQTIHLQSGSLLDASGITKAITTTTGAGTFVTGQVLGGGKVQLNVRSSGNAKGSVITDEGSTIDVSGTSGDLDLGRTPGKTHLSAAAGSVEVASADGIVLAGALKANRPDASVSGGQFKLSLSREGYTDLLVSGPGIQAYSTNERQVNVLGAAADVTSHGAQANQAVISSDNLLSAGFDRIELRADDKITLGSGVNLAANPAVAGSVPLRSLILTSPVLSADDHQLHTLQAAYVSLGNRDLVPTKGLTAFPVPDAVKGDAGLTVNAGLIELYGDSALQGFGSGATSDATVKLNATLSAQNEVGQRRDGEVRLVGTSFRNGNQLNGQLNFVGDLSITAGQIYATTLSHYTLQGTSGDSTLTTLQPSNGSTSATPLSAFGDLTLAAYDIHHQGVIRQPFGSISLKAENNAFLADDSILSVTGDGVNVPVGTTINGAQWFYDTQGTVFNEINPQSADATVNSSSLSLSTLPVGKGVLVKGKGLTIASQAGVQAQAGGDVLAWEFSAGVGGSTDTLNRPGVFAILPGYTYDFAPNDAEITASTKAAGTTLNAGDQVEVLTGSSVLAAGRYTLLPARYAVLPGAVLVSTSSLKTPTTLTTALAPSDDGSVQVSGYKTGVGTQINGGNDKTLALTLEPEATFRAKSTLTVTSINDYLTRAAEKQRKAVPTLPGEAGRASLSADSNFDWAAQFNLNGGELDLSMPKIEVVADGQAAQDGYAAISAKQLKATGAASVLLGGTRSGTADNAAITTESTDVSIASSLAGGEWIAVASNAVSVQDGVSVAATGSRAGTHALTLSGKGAALVVSNVDQIEVSRSLSGTDGVADQGTLSLGASARVAGSSIEMDAVKQLAISDTAAIDTQAMGLGAQHIVLGAKSDDPTALSIEGALLAQLNATQSVKLRSYSSIDLAGSTTLGLAGDDQTLLMNKLVLDTPELRGLGAASDTATLQAKELTWRNTTGQVARAESSDAHLVMRAQPPLRDTETGGLTLGEGSKQANFASTTLQSQGDAILSGKGSLNTLGDLTIQAARLTADTAANQSVVSQGVLTVGKQANAHTLNERLGAGATVALTGQRVVQDGIIDLPSGQLNLTGTGQSGQPDTVVLTAQSQTLASGWAQQAGTNWTVTAPGGNIQIAAQQGDVVLDGVLDVSAPIPTSASDTAKGAGTVTVSAVGTEGKLGAVRLGDHAQIKGSAASDKLSGALQVDAQQMVDEGAAATTGGTLDRLVSASQAGGMHREIDVRVRQGDQSLNTALKAQRVNLSADGGSLTLMNNGNIDATAPQGGVISLAAQGDLVVSATSIKADSTRAGANGGDILLSSTQGFVRLENDQTQISAQGDDPLDGRVILRAQRHDDAVADADRVNIKPIHAHIAAGEVDVEAVRTYQGNTFATVSHAANKQIGLNNMASDASNFMSHKDDVNAALSLAAHVTGSAHVRTGTEVQSVDSFTLSKDLSMPDVLHAGGEPMNLTIRAAKDVNINGSLSDGFANAGRSTSSATAILSEGAGSFRIVAGSDLSAADVMQTQAGSGGNLTIAAGKLIRTTDGSIQLAAAQNIELKTNYSAANRTPTQASVYVAGRLAQLSDGQAFSNPNVAWSQFTDHGGRLELNAGGNVVAPGAAQTFANWFYHTSNPGSPLNTAWWSSFDAFKQGVGSFGGGNVDVRAGGNISNLAVVAPTSARTVDDVLTIHNGGDIDVRAQGDVRGGSIFAGRGMATVVSGGAMTKGDALNTNLPTTALNVGLMDAQVSLQSKGDLAIEMVTNPTIWRNATRIDKTSGSTSASYFTYSDASALTATSVTGDVNWDMASSGVTYTNPGWKALSIADEQMSTSIGKMSLLTRVAPSSMSLAALEGQVKLNLRSQNEYLYPSPQGGLSIHGETGVMIQSGGAAVTQALVVSHGTPDQLATPSAPISATKYAAYVADKILQQAQSGSKSTQAGINELLSSDLHANDHVPVRIHSGADIQFDNNVQVNVPKRFEIEAAGDINNLAVVADQFHESDTSSIVAGGSFNGATNIPGVSRPNGLIQLSGPGQLLVSAGLQMNLSSSAGIETVGNQYNGALPNVAAKIRVAAGMAKTVVLPDFESRYLDGNTQAQQDLVAYVQSALNVGADQVGNFAQAWQRYQKLAPANQTAIANAVINRAFYKAFLAPGAAYADQWAAAAATAGVATTDFSSDAYRRMKDEVVMAEIKRVGTLAVAIHDSTDAAENALRAQQREALWSTVANTLSLAGLGDGFKFAGDINLAGSKAYSNAPGDVTHGGIDLFAPGGQVVVGLSTLSNFDKQQAATRGLVTAQGGSIRSVSAGDFQVNAQKAFVVGSGDLMVFSENGNIDSGRGANTDVTVPTPIITRDSSGNVVVTTPAATTGSGIGILKNADGTSEGAVSLYAPHGEILALDAFIRNEGGGAINVAGPVKGADNLKGAVSGLAPVAVATPAINVPTNLPTDATSAAAAEATQDKKKKEPNSMVTVDLLGMGDDALPPPAAGHAGDDKGDKKPCKKTDGKKDDDKKSDPDCKP
ncbi:MAG: filamentous hemagglutinin family protein [Burkholderiales bacterium]|nr:filamentous hemagglutinin family protein [Burkholderiales bacterium]